MRATAAHTLTAWRLHVSAGLRVRAVETLSALQGLLGSTSGRQILPCFGVTGQLNLGDEILAEIAQTRCPNNRLVFLTRRGLSQRAISLGRTHTGLGMLVGGGTLLLSEELRLILDPLTAGGASFATFGTGAQDLRFWGSLTDHQRVSWTRILRQGLTLGVRGPKTKHILASLGCDRAEVVGDPAVLYTRRTYHPPSPERILGVNFGTALGHVWGGDERVPRLRLIDALRKTKRHGWRIRFFCVWPNDLPVVRELARQTGIANPEIIVEYSDADRYMREVSHCRVFIGMKLHAAILSICAGVATAALEYQPKHADYMSSINSEAELVRIDRIEGQALADMIDDLGERAREVSERQWESSSLMAATFESYLSRLTHVLA